MIIFVLQSSHIPIISSVILFNLFYLVVKERFELFFMTIYFAMAFSAQCYSIVDVEYKKIVFVMPDWSYMVCLQPPAALITHLAGVIIAYEDSSSPIFICHGMR